MDDLDAVAILHLRLGPVRTPDHGAIELDRDAFGREGQTLDKLPQIILRV